MFVRLALNFMQNHRDFVDVILLYTNPCHQCLEFYTFMLHQIPYTRPYNIHNKTSFPAFHLQSVNTASVKLQALM